MDAELKKTIRTELGRMIYGKSEAANLSIVKWELDTTLSKDDQKDDQLVLITVKEWLEFQRAVIAANVCLDPFANWGDDYSKACEIERRWKKAGLE